MNVARCCCITRVSGCFEPRVIEEVVHKRTVNLQRGLGCNIAMDRVWEFLNAEFKSKYPVKMFVILTTHNLPNAYTISECACYNTQETRKTQQDRDTSAVAMYFTVERLLDIHISYPLPIPLSVLNLAVVYP